MQLNISTTWQVTLCDPVWHASFRRGEEGCITKGDTLYRVYFTYLLRAGPYSKQLLAETRTVLARKASDGALPILYLSRA